MKIKYMKINGFGKFTDKEIHLQDRINLIYGSNEAGKTTLLKFISNMLYGASKNKKMREYSDYDKYKPWQSDEFSGKMEYMLDDGRKFDLFRDFSKKTPRIFDSEARDITNNFSIDKNKGSMFFVEQTKIDEDLFFSTMVAEQQEVALNQVKQSTLIQKLTNLVSTGDDNISFKRSIERLNKKLLDDIGTARTLGKPLNLIEDELENIGKQKQNMEKQQQTLISMEKEKKIKKRRISELESTIDFAVEIKELKLKEDVEKEKVNINKNILAEYSEEINVLEGKAFTNLIKKRKILPPLLVIPIFGILAYGIYYFSESLADILSNGGLNFDFISKDIINIGGGILLAILFLSYLLDYFKYNNTKNNKRTDDALRRREAELLRDKKQKLEDRIDDKERELSNIVQQSKKEIIRKYEDFLDVGALDDIILKDTKDLTKYIQSLQKEYEAAKIELNTLDVKCSSLQENLIEQASFEERIELLEEQRSELLKTASIINLTKVGLEEAYSKMKNTITPKFTKDLSILVDQITGGRYRNVKFSEEQGLAVELNNGEYVSCNKLSIGTIDQIYLSLRIGATREVTNETMPIILDESFAYYDSNRLRNILEYIKNEFYNYQVLILTCTDRERNILNSMSTEYNYVEL